ncbi:MAG: TPM domain-containing protein [Elusimicrobia bacterium]|nr:TPM domain-containing protein [Elusimicrobiota bacterium]
MRKKLLLFSAAFFLSAPAPALAPEQLPPPQGWVNDLAEVLETAHRNQLRQFLREVQIKTGAEIAVVTLPSLEGENLEDFATLLYERWGIGAKGKDNGALILVSIQERAARIEVGYGLEPILPDGLAGRILREKMIPRFQQQDYAGGILQGAFSIAQIVAQSAGVSLSAPQAFSSLVSSSPHRDSGGGWWLLLLLLILFPFFLRNPFLFLFLMAPRGVRGGGGFGMGGGFGGFGGGLSGGGGASGRW